MINNEPAGGGIDVAFWFMTDDRYRQALQRAHERGVRVRVLVDPRANPTKPGNVQILANLAAAGIPMRKKAPQSGSDILHWKIMLFERQQNGKPVVEFSAANYTPDSFVPSVPYQNYIDEVVYFTDDPRITGTFADEVRGLLDGYERKISGLRQRGAAVRAPLSDLPAGSCAELPTDPEL